MLVSILTYIIAQNTRKICASAKKNSEKQKKRLDNLKGYKEFERKDQEDNQTLVKGSIYSVWGGGGGDGLSQLLVNLTKSVFSSNLTFINKMT